MEKLGKVIGLKGSIAEIQIKRDSACGENCAACGLCANRELTVTLPVGEDIRIGDTVRLSSADKGILGLSAVGYLSLTILLILGGVIGTYLGGEWLGFALSILTVVCGVFILRKTMPKGTQINVEKV